MADPRSPPMLRPPMVPGPSPVPQQEAVLKNVLAFLRQHNFKEAESALVREVQGSRVTSPGSVGGLNMTTPSPGSVPDASDLTVLLQTHQQKAARSNVCRDPPVYFNEYDRLLRLVHTAPENAKLELSLLLYPIFVHMYLELIAAGHREHACGFFNRHARHQDTCWAEELKLLRNILRPGDADRAQWFGHLRKNAFVIRLAQSSFAICRPQFEPGGMALVDDIVRSHIHLEIYDAPIRTAESIRCLTGCVLGETLKQANRIKIYHGVCKDTSSSSTVTLEPPEDETDKKRSKKSKPSSKVESGKRGRTDPHAPPPNRIPLPEVSDVVKRDRLLQGRDFSKRLRINKEKLPSICMYTVTNAMVSEGGLCSTCVSDDSTHLATGSDDGSTRVWFIGKPSADGQGGLKAMKQPGYLGALDMDSEDVMEEMLDPSTATNSLLLPGHSGPVNGVSLAPDKTTILSAGDDATVRLWSLQTRSTLVVYRHASQAFWDVTYCPTYGYYFATAGADRFAALWVTDRPQPLRVFAGHLSDVKVVRMHPNANYVVSGSFDHSVRIWDVTSGHCVRYFTGNAGAVTALAVSPDGRLVASGCTSGDVVLWDIAQARMLGYVPGAHTAQISSIAFNREGSALATGSLDNSMRLMSLSAAIDDMGPVSDTYVPDMASPRAHTSLALNSPADLGHWRTKATPVLDVHFTWRNLLLGFGSGSQT